MSQPDSGEYSVRSLAEILREHGLESELGTKPGRRRRSTDEPGSTGRSPRVEAPARAPRPSAPATPGRTSSAHPSLPVTTWPPEQSAGGARPAAGLAGPSAPARKPSPNRAAAPDKAAATAEPRTTTGAAAGRTEAAPPPVRTGRRTSDTAAPKPAAEQATGLFGTGPSTSAIPALDTSTTGRGSTAHPVTGPIPVQRTGADPTADDDAATAGGALAWARFAGELVLALAVGIGLYFAFTVLWELVPYVALVAAPAAVTGLVTAVAAYRQRRGEGQLGIRLLAVLLLAGTVLVIAPAAGLLAG